MAYLECPPQKKTLYVWKVRTEKWLWGVESASVVSLCLVAE